MSPSSNRNHLCDFQLEGAGQVKNQSRFRWNVDLRRFLLNITSVNYLLKEVVNRSQHRRQLMPLVELQVGTAFGAGHQSPIPY